MSGEARPISPARFASALTDLPVSNLYGKTFEIRNSIAHLQRSNAELQAYSDSVPGGDSDCQEAIMENELVIERMKLRIELVKAEVERRGQRWHETGDEDDEEGVTENGHTNGTGGDLEGFGQEREEVREHHQEPVVSDQREPNADAPSAQTNESRRASGGRLTDEELRRQLLERMSGDDDEGMFL